MGSAESSSAAEAFVSEQVAKNKVVVFGKSTCPYCVKARNAIKSVMGQDFQFADFNLDQRDDGASIQAALKAKTDISTVPQVFIGGKFFGDGSFTAAQAQNGGLKTAIEAATAAA